MTEEDAKKKWCPLMDKCYVVDEEKMGFDGLVRYVHESSPRCVASECMMWVWNKGPGKITLIDDKGNNNEIGLPVVRLNTGYCGLVRIS